MVVVDSSVIVGALHFPTQKSRDMARSAIKAAPRPLAQALSESYSTLTRLPIPIRISPQVAWNYLESAFPGSAIVLNADEHHETLKLLAHEGISGGRIYDGIIGAAARSVGAKLITADRRAGQIYLLIGVEFELVVPDNSV